MKARRQRGQALILIALAFIGLASFIGLAVDAGILFTAIGHLRRAVDAAALAAANQFREDRSLTDLHVSATEFINLNAVSDNPADVDVNICTYTPDFGMVWGVDPENDALCPDPDGPGPSPATGPDRKFVEGRYPKPTTSGRAVIVALEDHANQITQPEMTAHLEQDMDEIARGVPKPLRRPPRSTSSWSSTPRLR